MAEKIYNLPPCLAGWRRFLVFGDVHLLHGRVPTAHIVNILTEKIIDAGRISAIYLVGALWDDSRYLRTEDSKVAIAFIVWLLNYCKVQGIALRVLEGTPSHDHKQSEMIVNMNATIGADAMYLNEVGVMYDPAIDAVIGWVQDEYRIDATETERIMDEKMLSGGYDKLDFCFMHGMFKFQSPVENIRYFDMSFWLARVRQLIMIGHDHRPKQWDRIRVTGSPERLSHGEEEDKGVTIVDYDGQHTRDYFWVNERAVPQFTVRVTEDYDACLAQCLERINRILAHPSCDLGRLKIEYYDGSPIAANVAQWKREYPFKIELDKISNQQELDAVMESFNQDDDEEEPILPDTIERLMLEATSHLPLKPDIVSSIVRSVQ